MTRTARLLVAVTAAGFALTGCAAGLTSGDRGAAPASVAQAADDGGSRVDIPAAPTTSDTDSGVTPGGGISVSEDGITAPGVSVGSDGITAPGVSVGPDGITAPGVTVGPDGVAVDPEIEQSAESAGAPYVSRACADGEAVTVVDNAATVILSGSCASVDVLADSAYVTLEDGGAISVSGNGNTVITASYTSLEVTGDSNYVQYGEGAGAPVDTGTGNTLIG